LFVVSFSSFCDFGLSLTEAVEGPATPSSQTTSKLYTGAKREINGLPKFEKHPETDGYNLLPEIEFFA